MPLVFIFSITSRLQVVFPHQSKQKRKVKYDKYINIWMIKSWQWYTQSLTVCTGMKPINNI